ncbi:UNVERIFIED_CONTAM: hypothetical protein K2H54_027941 [Gekko kuhli]
MPVLSMYLLVYLILSLKGLVFTKQPFLYLSLFYIKMVIIMGVSIKHCCKLLKSCFCFMCCKWDSFERIFSQAVYLVPKPSAAMSHVLWPTRSLADRPALAVCSRKPNQAAS